MYVCLIKEGIRIEYLIKKVTQFTDVSDKVNNRGGTWASAELRELYTG